MKEALRSEIIAKLQINYFSKDNRACGKFNVLEVYLNLKFSLILNKLMLSKSDTTPKRRFLKTKFHEDYLLNIIELHCKKLRKQSTVYSERIKKLGLPF